MSLAIGIRDWIQVWWMEIVAQHHFSMIFLFFTDPGLKSVNIYLME